MAVSVTEEQNFIFRLAGTRTHNVLRGPNRHGGESQLATQPAEHRCLEAAHNNGNQQGPTLTSPVSAALGPICDAGQFRPHWSDAAPTVQAAWRPTVAQEAFGPSGL
jgi:hypothetical protein